MKKTILALGLMVALTSCSDVAPVAEAPVADSTVVAVDTAVIAIVADTTSVDSVKVVK